MPDGETDCEAEKLLKQVKKVCLKVDAEGWKKGISLMFAFLEVNQQTYANNRYSYGSYD